MLAPETVDQPHQLVQRARPLLGTMVTIQVRVSAHLDACGGGLAHVHHFIDKAFSAIQEIERAMSAHSLDSDLARLARVAPGEVVELSKHTVNVLRLAKYWYQTSLGAIDPVAAGNRLSALGMRPAFHCLTLSPDTTLRELRIIDPDRVSLERPMRLDLGGIAKGYAVDRAVSVLATGGLDTALINAGGDLRACGPYDWPVQVRSPYNAGRARNLKGLRSIRDAALATSTGTLTNPEFVPSGRFKYTYRWATCTVQARDCVTADALTKWGLQSGQKAPRLDRILRAHGASIWRA